jgi:transcriptional regulator with XRE-family HTH domain
VYEDLLNAVSALVHRHVLRELHDMTGAMLARLDTGGEREPTKPAITAPSAKLSTIERKLRRQRARQRQAANGAAAPVMTVPAGTWPGLRSEFHAEIKRRRLTRAQIAADLGVSKGSFCGWLLSNGAPPSAANIRKIRAWLEKPAPKTPVALDKWPALREQLRAVIRDRGLTHAQIGQVLGVESATVGAWIAKSHDGRMPGARALISIRAWLREGAAMPTAAAADLPPFVLSIEERAALAGYISLTNAPELRDRFGATRELLERASIGAHLDAEVIAKLRIALAGDGAAPE